MSETVRPGPTVPAVSPVAVVEPTTQPRKPTPASPRDAAQFTAREKIFSAVYTEDITWTGTLLVEGMVTVAPQATLTVLPGTVVYFAANSGVMVFGRLTVRGTADRPVYFNSLFTEPGPADWSGIVLAGSEKRNSLEYLRLSGADTALLASFSSLDLKGLHIAKSATAIRLQNSLAALRSIEITAVDTGIMSLKSEVEIDRSSIADARAGVIMKSSSLYAENLAIANNRDTALLADKSQLKISRSSFTANRSGARLTECDGSITSSRFTGNAEVGVVFTASLIKFSGNSVTGNRIGLQLSDGAAAVWNNAIAENPGYNFHYAGDENIFLGGNWLGTDDPQLAERTAYSRQPGLLKLTPYLHHDPLQPVDASAVKVGS
jgi:hypothetical protein